MCITVLIKSKTKVEGYSGEEMFFSSGEDNHLMIIKYPILFSC